jgi:hypothetical protein
VNRLLLENTNLTREIEQLTVELHQRVFGPAPGSGATGSDGS